MKIKCPFCKNIYDPEACDNTCPACNKTLMVSVFKKKPEGKPGGGPATVIRPPTVITPKPPPPPPIPAPTSAPVLKPTPSLSASTPAAERVAPVAEFVAPKAPSVVPIVKPPPVMSPPVATPASEPAPVPSTKPTKVIVAPAAPVPPPPVEHVHEKKHAHHDQPKAGLDLVISIQRSESKDWDAVIRMPVQVFKFANLIPARAREAIESEGIDFEELRKAVEHADHVGPLLDIQTQTQRVHIAIEPHG